MKKLCIITLCLFAGSSFFAMEVYKKSEKRLLIAKGSLVKKTDWPFLSFQEIKSGMLVSRRSLRRLKRDCKAISFVRVVNVLPQDLITDIFHKMLDDNEKAIEKYQNMSLIYVFQECRRVKEMFDTYPQWHNKSVGMFLGSLIEEQIKLLTAVQPSWKSQLIFGEGRVGLTKEQIQDINGIDVNVRKEFVEGHEVIEIDIEDIDELMCPSEGFKSTVAVTHSLGCSVGITGIVLLGVLQDALPGGAICAVGASMELLVCCMHYCRARSDIREQSKEITL